MSNTQVGVVALSPVGQRFYFSGDYQSVWAALLRFADKVGIEDAHGESEESLKTLQEGPPLATATVVLTDEEGATWQFVAVAGTFYGPEDYADPDFLYQALRYLGRVSGDVVLSDLNFCGIPLLVATSKLTPKTKQEIKVADRKNFGSLVADMLMRSNHMGQRTYMRVAWDD